jgi:RNA polymerase sigma-70 factor (ECF subfamily)
MDMANTLNTATATSTGLLDGLRDPANRAVWSAYVARYRPILLGYGQRLGLSADEAEDAAQQALVEFVRQYQADKYHREEGRLRSWLFGIARNQILNWKRRHRNREQLVTGDSTGTDIFTAQPQDDVLERVWEEEWHHAVLRECLGMVRSEVEPSTFAAFELFVVQGWRAARVAERLNMTENAVFKAKRRILRRARELLPVVKARL